ncbi:MAG: Rpn family recombination-promoting nuclease/putative transposase, partial [Desulfamplus sp.]|nr:Rpn family recombination-promoting nuclease/putative transposase [Desulfamplus sp.]
MKHKIDPKVDCVFKALLGSEKNKNLLIHFLNAVIGFEGGNKITNVKILNPYNERKFIDDKLSIVDIKASCQNNFQYQIEIQLAVYPSLPSRILY